jgi:hypothetical protein
MKMLSFWVACTFWCLGTHASAQIIPVGEEFYGEWTFDHAQAQERPLDSKESFTNKDFSKDDIYAKSYFKQIPLQITISNNMALVESPLGIGSVQTAYNSELNTLEFVDTVVREDGETEYVTSMPLFFNLTLKGNTMSMQCNYFYGTKEDSGRKYTEGILTIHYSK